MLTITRPDDWHLHLRDGESLAAVVHHTAAVFARAGERAISDDAATEAARALVGDRASVNAVRLEAPPELSTVLRSKDSAEVVPESTPELRARADADADSAKCFEPCL